MSLMANIFIGSVASTTLNIWYNQQSLIEMDQFEPNEERGD